MSGISPYRRSHLPLYIHRIWPFQQAPMGASLKELHPDGIKITCQALWADRPFCIGNFLRMFFPTEMVIWWEFMRYYEMYMGYNQLDMLALGVSENGGYPQSWQLLWENEDTDKSKWVHLIFPQSLWPDWGVLTVRVKAPVLNRGHVHFDCAGSHKMLAAGLASGIFPVNSCTKCVF